MTALGGLDLLNQEISVSWVKPSKTSDRPPRALEISNSRSVSYSYFHFAPTLKTRMMSAVEGLHQVTLCAQVQWEEGLGPRLVSDVE